MVVELLRAHVAGSLGCSLLPLVRGAKDDVGRVSLSVAGFYFGWGLAFADFNSSNQVYISHP